MSEQTDTYRAAPTGAVLDDSEGTANMEQMTSKREAAPMASRADRRREMAQRRRDRVARAIGADRGPVLTGDDVEAAQRSAPTVGGWSDATADRLRREARSVSKSSAAPPADDLVQAALLRAWEHAPEMVAALSDPDPAKREAGHRWVRGAMRSVAGTAVRSALVPGAYVFPGDVTRDAATDRRERLRAAALDADGPVEAADPDGARWRVTSADRFAALLDGTRSADGKRRRPPGQDAADRVKYGRGMAKIGERHATRGAMRDSMVKAPVRLLREASLERMMAPRSTGSRPLEGGGSLPGGKVWHDDRDALRHEAAAGREALRVALSDRLPFGAAGSLTRSVAVAAGELVTLSAAGWLRRAAALQRDAVRLAGEADRLSREADSLTDPEGRPDGPGRKRAKGAALSARSDATGCEAGALALVGAVGAADGRPLDFLALVAAATDVSREGRPFLDARAVLAALSLPMSDPAAKALRRSLRVACATPGADVTGSGAGATRVAALADTTLAGASPVGRWSALRDRDRSARSALDVPAAPGSAPVPGPSARVAALAWGEVARLREADRVSRTWRTYGPARDSLPPVAPAVRVVPAGRTGGGTRVLATHPGGYVTG